MKILKATHSEGAVYWKEGDGCPETSTDGKNWNFTFRGENEFRLMFKNCKIEEFNGIFWELTPMEKVNKLALDLGLFVGYMPDGSLRIAEKDFTI